MWINLMPGDGRGNANFNGATARRRVPNRRGAAPLNGG
jgi:hypothetical protein